MRAALLLATLAAPAWAEAPVTALVPPVRPAEAGAPEVLARAPDLAEPPVPATVTKATRDFLPVVPRRPPGLGEEPPAEPLDGPPQEVRAEEAMQSVASLDAVKGGWEGLRPAPRPTPELSAAVPNLRPLPRPAEAVAAVRLPDDPEAPEGYEPPPPVGGDHSVFAVAFALRPPVRPHLPVDDVVQVSARATASGSLCGLPGLDGETVAPVLGRGGCGIDQPVRVRSVDGVRLTEGALMTCGTAEALLGWVREGAKPAVGARGGGIAALRVAAHYACRPRNNQSGARLSEHGMGRAIDIGAVLLADGTELSVANDWPDPALVAMHRAACGPFSTTLGPGSDGFHEDHLHLDTAPRGDYCR